MMWRLKTVTKQQLHISTPRIRFPRGETDCISCQTITPSDSERIVNEAKDTAEHLDKNVDLNLTLANFLLENSDPRVIQDTQDKIRNLERKRKANMKETPTKPPESDKPTRLAKAKPSAKPKPKPKAKITKGKDVGVDEPKRGETWIPEHREFRKMIGKHDWEPPFEVLMIHIVWKCGVCFAI